jgi:hypothetical protein
MGRELDAFVKTLAARLWSQARPFWKPVAKSLASITYVLAELPGVQ